MTTPWLRLHPRSRAKLIRDLVARGPFGLPVANRLAPFANARRSGDGIEITDGAVFATRGSHHWVCNPSAAVIALLAETGPNLQAELEARYAVAIDPAMVAVGEARLIALGLLSP